RLHGNNTDGAKERCIADMFPHKWTHILYLCVCGGKASMHLHNHIISLTMAAPTDLDNLQAHIFMYLANEFWRMSLCIYLCSSLCIHMSVHLSVCVCICVYVCVCVCVCV